MKKHINNKFISVYDILTHLNDENFLKWANSDGSHAYSDKKFREYVPLRKTQEEGWISKENRINYVKKNIQELYDRTVAIYLNIGSLM